MNDPLIHIGELDHRGQPLPFGLSAADARQHLYLIGKTGSGKTTLLRNLLVQHIAAGHGVGLIDPHGDLAAKVRAVLRGRFHVTLADVEALALPVLRHRIVPTFNAEAEGIKVDDIIVRILKMVPRGESKRVL